MVQNFKKFIEVQIMDTTSLPNKRISEYDKNKIV